MALLMHMLLSNQHLGSYSLLASVFWLLLTCSLCFGVDQSDINCLESIKHSLEDPLGSLNSWDFNNNTEGFICKFSGIECWNPAQSLILNIKLSNSGLKGQFPRGLANCTSLTGLDLSNNKLSGPIPTDIDRTLSFITFLDLSSNSFSGKLPASLSNCSYLNVLKLDNNQFSGSIPPELGQLNRLKTFSVANNLLSGPVPDIRKQLQRQVAGPLEMLPVGPDSYEGNSGLCGAPLKRCRTSLAKVFDFYVVIAAAAGFGFAFPFSFCFFLPRSPSIRYFIVVLRRFRS